jgi:CheY-like chemotaxis protein
MMPSLFGYEVAKAVRSDPDLKDVKVVLFSSVDEEDVDWVDAGANVFLQKPIDICALPELLQNLIDGVPHNPPMPRRYG